MEMIGQSLQSGKRRGRLLYSKDWKKFYGISFFMMRKEEKIMHLPKRGFNFYKWC